MSLTMLRALTEEKRCSDCPWGSFIYWLLGDTDIQQFRVCGPEDMVPVIRGSKKQPR